MREIKESVRALRAARGSTTAALILLTVGIGATTAIFSVVDAVLRGLPFGGADRLVVVSGRNLRTGTTLQVPPADYLDWKAQQDAFEDLGAADSRSDLLTEAGATETVLRTRVTASLFSVLGVRPHLGTLLTTSHEVQGNNRVLVLSDGFWRRRFGGDPSVIGRTMTFEKEVFEIVGILPRGFTYPLAAERQTDIYAPYVVPASQRVRGSSRSFALQIIGRLKPGVDVAEAQQRMERLHQGLTSRFPDWFVNRGIAVTDLREFLIGRVRSWMQLLLGAVGFLLLLVSVNVSGLALARGLARVPEIGIRAALGATRWRIVRGIVIENAVLSAAGAACGAAIAYGAVAVLRAALPAAVPRVAAIAVDARVLAVAAAAAMLTALICSILPALKFSRADVMRALRYGRARSEDGRPAAGRAGGLLVSAEVGLAAILLVGAGLFLSSFNHVMRVDLGLDYRNVLTVPAHVRFASFEERTRAAERASVMLPAALERVRTIPGVEAAAAIAGGVPLSGGSIRSSMQVRGRAVQLDDDVVDVHHVSAEYFDVLRIPLLQGRLLSAADGRAAPRVVVLSDAAARKYFPDGDALGAMVGVEVEQDLQVVGVVGNLRLDGPERPVRPEVYVPMSQGIVTGADLIVRTIGDPLALAPAVKAAIRAVEPGAVIMDALSLEARLERLIAPRKFNMLLFTVLGVLAVAIAATGVYAMLAQHVEHRAPEIGVRLALGAAPRQILGLVMGRASRALGAGLIVGVAGAWLLARFVEAFLFEMTPYDATVFTTAGGLLLVAGAIAAFIPARRAMQTDPLTTLKS